jgi:hypothetical protein
MTQTRSVPATKSNTSYQKYNSSGDDSYHKGRGDGVRCVAGRGIDEDKFSLRFRTYLYFDLSTFWANVEKVTDATIDLVFSGDNDNPGDIVNGNTGRVVVNLLSKNFSEGGSSTFVKGDYEWPAFNQEIAQTTDAGSGEPDTPFTLNVMKLLRKVAPKHVFFEGEDAHGRPGDFHGFILRGAPESNEHAAVQFWSRHATTASYRPTLTITYVPENTPPTAGLTDPSGDVPSNFTFTGTFDDEDADDRMTTVEVQVKKSNKEWTDPLVLKFMKTLTDTDGEWALETDDFSHSDLVKGTTYHARCRVYDKKNKESAWTNGGSGDDEYGAPNVFTITADAPTVTVQPVGTVTNSDGLALSADYTVDALTEAVQADVQLGPVGLSTLLWSYSYPLTNEERNNDEVRATYAGPNLPAGGYEWRVRITDSLGGVAEWDNDIFTIEEDSPDDEGDLEFTTGYSNIRPAQRILIKDMNYSNRGPGKVIAIIEDFSNLGVSWYASAPGELYFTLPVTHPQVAVIEPMTTHYEYQQYRRGRWVGLAYGLIRDFDAKEDDVVFYGIDYLGLLSWSIEAAKQTAKEPKRAMGGRANDVKGSRYLKKTIKHIIVDQLARARAQDSNSPVKFIETGRIDNYSTIVTIYASYAERLSFIRGLIDSHKGSQANGEERRSRIRVRWNPSSGGGRGRFQFEALDGVGKNRPNIRLEYGSIIQGYRVVALDEFASIVYGIGKVPNATLPYFSNVNAPGISQTTWGSIGRANFWSDIVDSADLTRRARAMGTRLSRIGKRVALGLRVSGIDVFDGYDILDSFPVSIEDGVVSTSQYGSGYWTMWGLEYRLYPDEHDEVTFILRPRGDTDSIDADLIPSQPIHFSSDWAWGSGPP